MTFPNKLQSWQGCPVWVARPVDVYATDKQLRIHTEDFISNPLKMVLLSDVERRFEDLIKRAELMVEAIDRLLSVYEPKEGAGYLESHGPPSQAQVAVELYKEWREKNGASAFEE